VVGIGPRWSRERFRSLFSAGTAWGSVTHERDAGGVKVGIEVAGGTLSVCEVHIDLVGRGVGPQVSVLADGRPVGATLVVEDRVARVALDERLLLGPDLRLAVRLTGP
jgi:hypothetical protein